MGKPVDPAVPGALLAFAAMLKLDYGVPKDVALKGLALAYDMTDEKKSAIRHNTGKDAT